LAAPPKLTRCEHRHVDAVAVIEQVVIIQYQRGPGGPGPTLQTCDHPDEE
jgi:hypothetical protein